MARKSQTPAIFVPGGVMPADLSYAALLREIGSQRKLILKDLEVYAGDTPPADYELATEAEGIGRVADREGFDRFHLVGYSGGGASSLAFATRYPERLESLALVEPAWAGNDGWSPEEVDYWREIDRIMALPEPELMRGFMVLNTGSGTPPEPPSGPQPEWMSKRPAGLNAMIRAFRRPHVDLEVLRQFDRPVYIAVGGKSHPSEMRKAERLASLFPDARIDVFQDRHHIDPPHRAEAARFATALLELWDRAERRSARAA